MDAYSNNAWDLPLIEKIDRLVEEEIPDLHYAIKWGSAYYGTPELGWIIEVAAYDVTANIVFLSGAQFDDKPPLGEGESRYIKLSRDDEVRSKQIVNWIRQARSIAGWK